MYKIIICEGKTDAILVSYYLEKVANWKHISKIKRLPNLSLQLNDELNWYHNGSSYLAIWSIGGNSNFSKAIETIEKYISVANFEESFSKIILLTDRDTGVVQDIVSNLFSLIPGISSATPQNNSLHSFELNNQFDQQISFEVGIIVIPFEVEGAIETFLLNSLASDSQELKDIILIVEEMIDNTIIAPSYLPKTRDKLKAKLGVTLAIISPEKVFSELHIILQGIQWEKYTLIQDGFKLIKDV